MLGEPFQYLLMQRVVISLLVNSYRSWEIVEMMMFLGLLEEEITDCINRGGNKAGEFIKLMKVENGTVKSLMIPKESNGAGWSNFYIYIKGFFNCDKKMVLNVGKIRNAGVNTMEEEPVSEMIKDWRKAITIFCSNTKMSWKEISSKLGAIIKRKAEVSQVAADRAIFWCLEADELEGLLLQSEQLSSLKSQVRMVNWKKEDHWENLQIGLRYSWIGIEGLPLHLWNIHVFKVISEACGGLFGLQ